MKELTREEKIIKLFHEELMSNTVFLLKYIGLSREDIESYLLEENKKLCELLYAEEG